jgi:hypothetical protein
MIAPGYRIYVPARQRNLTVTTAIVARDLVTFLAGLLPIISLYSLIGK